MIKKTNHKGVTLLETILALGLLGLLMIILIRFLQERAKELKLQTAASQMETVIDDAETYVKNNFSDIYNEIFNGGIGTGFKKLSLSDVYTNNSSQLVTYKNNSPFVENYEAVVRIPYDITATAGMLPEQQRLQVIVYAINNQKNLNWVDSKKLAKFIKNSQGGVVYAKTSPVSPCTTLPSSLNYCIASAYGIWLLEDNQAGLGNIYTLDIQTELDLISANMEIAPAVVAISNISIDQASTDYISRNKNTKNRNSNTVTTDINIDNQASETSSIFFNGLTPNDPKILEGSKLSYYGKSAVCDDFDGDGDTNQDLDDYVDNAPVGVLGPEDTCQISLFYKKPSIVFETTDPINQTAVFKAEGGLKTNLQVDEYSSCDIASNYQVIAVDKTTGSPLRCYNQNNSSECYDINNDGVIDILDYVDNLPLGLGSEDTCKATVTGEWRKIDWKKSFVFFSNDVNISSGAGTSTVNAGKSLEEFLGAKISSEAKWVILQVKLVGTGILTITTSGNSRTYPLINASTSPVITQVIDTTRQAIIEVPSNHSSTDWLTINVTDNTTTTWSVDIIGYVR